MPKICYVEKSFKPERLALIEKADEIIAEYQEQGYDLTLRQIYYQFVSRGLIENTERSYKNLGDTISDGRRAGLLDWNAVVDRTRNVKSPNVWDSPSDIIAACAKQYEVDRWENQKYRPCVWVEKDALVGVIEVACEPWHMPYFACRGYVSDSEIWASARRFAGVIAGGQIPVVFHLGDHDPSGIDMTRDIQDRLMLFSGHDIDVRRIALTMDQVDEYQPPPNPAKITDSRFNGYQELYGDESWELDALEPDVVNKLIAHHVKPLVNNAKWKARQKLVDESREALEAVSDNWDDVQDYLRNL